MLFVCLNVFMKADIVAYSYLVQVCDATDDPRSKNARLIKKTV